MLILGVRFQARRDKKRHKVEEQLVPLKEGYEEAFGISTPSKEVFCTSNKPLFTPLATNHVLTVVSMC